MRLRPGTLDFRRSFPAEQSTRRIWLQRWLRPLPKPTSLQTNRAWVWQLRRERRGRAGEEKRGLRRWRGRERQPPSRWRELGLPRKQGGRERTVRNTRAER